MAEAATARYVLYVRTREEGESLLRGEIRRNTWIQSITTITPPAWMQGVPLPILVDRRLGKAFAGGAEKEVLEPVSKTQTFGKVEELD